MFYPLFVDLEGKEILIVGGGEVGTKRALKLHSAGAKVTVVSKDFSKELKESGIKCASINVEDISLEPYFLIVLATDDKPVNEELAKKASDGGILVNRADDGTAGDVIFPMVSQVEGHTLAFTTLGENPKLLKQIKEKIENEFSKN